MTENDIYSSITFNKTIDEDLKGEVRACVKLFRKLEKNPKYSKDEFAINGFPLVKIEQVEALKKAGLTNIEIKKVGDVWLVCWVKNKIA